MCVHVLLAVKGLSELAGLPCNLDHVISLHGCYWDLLENWSKECDYPLQNIEVCPYHHHGNRFVVSTGENHQHY